MKAPTFFGNTIDLRPGESVGGLALASVEITAQDLDSDDFHDWFIRAVAPRLIRVPPPAPVRPPRVDTGDRRRRGDDSKDEDEDEGE